MTLVKPLYAIYCDPTHGPAFGGGCDTSIYDKCNANNNYSYAKFPFSYNFATKPYEIDSQATWTAFSGATKGNKFKVLEYEVFKV